MSNLHNTIEYINSLSQSDPKELIDRSEQRFKNIIRDVSDKVENDSGLQVVMLAGPSASGKTTTAQKLAEEFTRLFYSVSKTLKLPWTVSPSEK